MSWKVQAIRGDLQGQELSIDRDMLVGRHQTADIILQAAEISRKHAAFLIKDQALWVQDLGSSNGTFVNDVRIEAETLLKQGDIVQFATIPFSILAYEPAPVVEAPVIAPAATIAEDVAEEPLQKTAAQQMNDRGMPDLKERDASVQLTRDGMPTHVGVPKPAPIPEGIDLTAKTPAAEQDLNEIPATCQAAEQEAQKNASVGLISVIVLIILAILAWALFK